MASIYRRIPPLYSKKRRYGSMSFKGPGLESRRLAYDNGGGPRGRNDIFIYLNVYLMHKDWLSVP